MVDNKKAILICDDQKHEIQGFGLYVYWNSYDSSDQQVSLPALVEQYREELIDTYLDWITDIGQCQVNNKSVIELLQIRPDFSLWWMNKLTEKSIWKSPEIIDVFKLLALKKYLQIEFKELNHLQCILENKSIKAIVEQIPGFLSCDSNNGSGKSLKGTSFPAFFSHLFVLYIKTFYHLSRFTIFGILSAWYGNRNNIAESRGSIFFLSYLNLIINDSVEKAYINSGYWSPLQKLLENKQINTFWLQMYLNNPVVKSPGGAFKLVNTLNNSNQIQVHYLIYTFLTFPVVFKSILSFLKMQIRVSGLMRRPELFKINNSSLTLYGIVKKSWLDSLAGPSAFINCLYLEVFEAACKKLPKCDQGFYLQENQGWERAFLYAWKKNNQGRITGVPHTVVRKWDLRYVKNRDIPEFNCPEPDLIACNGMAAYERMIKNRVPANQCRKVEALRFMNIYDINQINNDRNSRKTLRSANRSRLLVLTDYSISTTNRQLLVLKEAITNNQINISIDIKCHPNTKVNINEWADLHAKFTSDPINLLVDNYDFVYASNPTSAVIDFYFNGITVITHLDPESFNLSPLAGLPNVKYVKSARQLQEALCDPMTLQNSIPENYFFTDTKLNGWNRLLTDPSM